MRGKVNSLNSMCTYLIKSNLDNCLSLISADVYIEVDYILIFKKIEKKIDEDRH